MLINPSLVVVQQGAPAVALVNWLDRRGCGDYQGLSVDHKKDLKGSSICLVSDHEAAREVTGANQMNQKQVEPASWCKTIKPLLIVSDLVTLTLPEGKWVQNSKLSEFCGRRKFWMESVALVQGKLAHDKDVAVSARLWFKGKSFAWKVTSIGQS